MAWPTGELLGCNAFNCRSGYVLRQATEADIPAFRALMETVQLGTWDDESLSNTLAELLPSSWQVIVHGSSGALVATGMALRRPITDYYPNGTELGWFAADPAHAGRGLGRAIVAATVVRALELGARDIFLQTDDFRIPAVKTYLSVGFLPDLWAADMPGRWQKLCAQLDWPYTPTAWPPSVPRSA